MSFNIVITHSVSFEKVSCLLACAFEQTRPWGEICGYVKPTFEESFFIEDEIFPHCDYPLSEDGGVLYRVKDSQLLAEDLRFYDDSVLLNKKVVRKGLALMATNFPRNMIRVMEDSYDAEDGDVFLQLCLFNKLVCS